jgi:hypothetical protein
MDNKRLAALLAMNEYYSLVVKYRNAGILASSYSSAATQLLESYISTTTRQLTTVFNNLPETGNPSLDQVKTSFSTTYTNGLTTEVKTAIGALVGQFLNRPVGATQSLYEKYCVLMKTTPETNPTFSALFYTGTTRKTDEVIRDAIYDQPGFYRAIQDAMNAERIAAQVQTYRNTVTAQVKFGDAKRPFSLLG